MKNKAITVFVVLVALGIFTEVVFGGSNIQTFYNDNIKDAVDSGVKEAKEAGTIVAGNAQEFALSVYDKVSERTEEGIKASVVEPASEALRNAAKNVLSTVLTEEEIKNILLDNQKDNCVCP